MKHLFTVWAARIAALPVLLPVLLLPQIGAAQTAYPSRTVRLMVPSAAGGGTDTVARVIAQKLSESLGQQFVVDNRPGAGQMIGTESVAKSPPDGYTLLMSASTLALNPIMYKKVPYDAVRDFAPVTQVASLPAVLLVHPSLPVKTVPELIALAKRRPGQIDFASAGIGTLPQISVELLKSMAGIDLVHIPYKGSAPGMIALLSGQVSVMVPNLFTSLPHIRAGKLRALGVTTAKRVNALPELPAIAETVPGYEFSQWYGVLAPAGTPREIVTRLQVEIARTLRLPELSTRLAHDGAEPVGSTPEDFAALIRSETVKWARVAKTAGIRPE